MFSVFLNTFFASLFTLFPGSRSLLFLIFSSESRNIIFCLFFRIPKYPLHFPGIKCTGGFIFPCFFPNVFLLITFPEYRIFYFFAIFPNPEPFFPYPEISLLTPFPNTEISFF